MPEKPTYEELASKVQKFEWMLTGRNKNPRIKSFIPTYGDMTRLNRSRLILDSVGDDLLIDIVNNYLALLDTSAAVYERNGDYALSINSSNWCRFLDHASRKLCGTDDNQKAMNCGKWLCHESCWTGASKIAIEKNSLVDIECEGGIRLYAVPIRAGNQIVGAMNFGYGDPPDDPLVLKKLAVKYGVAEENLVELATAYKNRPPFLIDLAKQSLLVSAQLIGEIVRRKLTEDALREKEKKPHIVESLERDYIIYSHDTQGNFTYLSPSIVNVLGYTQDEFMGHYAEYMTDNPINKDVGQYTEAGLRGEKQLPYEAEFWHKDGSRRHLEVTEVPKFDNEGNVTGIEGIVHDITQQKEAEKALRASEQKFKSIFNSSSDAVFIHDMEGCFLEVNEVACKRLGYTKTELLQLTPIDIDTPEFARLVPERIRTISENQKLIFEGAHRTKDGTVIPVEINARIIQHLEKTCILSAARDITERKKSEKEIQRKKEILDGINRIFREALTCENEQAIAMTCLAVTEELTGSKFGLIGELNDEGRFDTLAYTDTGMEACRIPKDEAWQKSLNMEVRGVWAQPILQGTAMIIEDPSSHPESIGTPHGHPHIHSYIGVPIKQGKDAVGIIAGANKKDAYSDDDIQALEALSIAFLEALNRNRAERALKESEKKFRAIANYTYDWETWHSTDGKAKWISPSVESHTGFTVNECLAMPDYPIPIIHEDDRSKVADTIREALEKKTSGNDFEFRIQKKDSSTCWMAISWQPAYDGSGEFIGIRSNIRNINDRKKDQEKIRDKEEKLRVSQKMEAIGQLAAGVAHEINNPIGFVSSNLKTLGEYRNDLSNLIHKYKSFVSYFKENGDNSTSVKDLLATITFTEEDIDIDYILEDLNNLITETIEGIERVKKIVIDLKDFAHPGNDSLSDVDVNKGIESTLNVIWNELKYKATVSKELGKIPYIKGYPQQLNQVFMNILVNAAQAIEEKGKIDITTQHRNGFVEIIISDTGSGIPEENLTKLFDPFFTTKEIGKGTGIGLNVSYNIIKQHSGSIDVKSRLGEGTTFTIKIPAGE